MSPSYQDNKEQSPDHRLKHNICLLPILKINYAALKSFGWTWNSILNPYTFFVMILGKLTYILIQFFIQEWNTLHLTIILWGNKFKMENL